jgi:hypothetical protein
VCHDVGPQLHVQIYSSPIPAGFGGRDIQEMGWALAANSVWNFPELDLAMPNDLEMYGLHHQQFDLINLIRCQFNEKVSQRSGPANASISR